MNNYMFKNKLLTAGARVISLVILFLGTALLVLAGMIFKEHLEAQMYSMSIVVIYLLAAPFLFGGAVFLATGIHQIVQQKPCGAKLNIGFAFLVLAAVDHIIYVPIRFGAAGTESSMILGAIHLVCLMLVFFYLYKMNSKPLAMFGSVLLTLSFGLELFLTIESFGYETSSGISLDMIYYLGKDVVNLLCSILAVMLTVGVEINYIERKDGK